MKSLQKQTRFWSKAWCQSGFRSLLGDHASLNSLRIRLVHVLVRFLFLSAEESSQDNFVPITIARILQIADKEASVLAYLVTTSRH